MKKLLFIIMFVLLSLQLAFADRIPVPSGSIRWDNFRDNYFNVQTEELYDFLGASESGELPAEPTFSSLIISGIGNSYLEFDNNAAWTDLLTGVYAYGFAAGYPNAIIDGTAYIIATIDDTAGAGDTNVTLSADKIAEYIAGVSVAAPTIQAADPTLASATGWFLAQNSGDLFFVNHGIEMFAVAGTRTADETAPVIAAGADSTHDGTTSVTATMVLTELYPDPSTLLYTVTGGTPTSGTWAGTYPNYSVEITPTGTDDIVVTSSGSDLAGNPATGTDLEQTFTYSGGVACSGDFSSGSNESFESAEDAFCTTDGTIADTTGVISTYDTNFYNTGTHGMSIVCDSDNSAANNRVYFDYGSTLSAVYLRSYMQFPDVTNYKTIRPIAIGDDNNESINGAAYITFAKIDALYQLKIRTAATNPTEYFPLAINTKYRLEILATNAGSTVLRVYNAAGTQLETSNGGGDVELSITGGGTGIRYIVIRDSSTDATAGTVYMDDVKMSTSGWVGAE